MHTWALRSTASVPRISPTLPTLLLLYARFHPTIRGRDSSWTMAHAATHAGPRFTDPPVLRLESGSQHLPRHAGVGSVMVRPGVMQRLSPELPVLPSTSFHSLLETGLLYAQGRCVLPASMVSTRGSSLGSSRRKCATVTI
nr:hypothetical protein CFP56_04261 [Quercus suber]